MCRIFFLLALLPGLTSAQVITTIAGTGYRGFSGDGGPAPAADLNQPLSVAVDDHGNLYIIDAGENNIRKIGAGGIISTIAGDREEYHKHPGPGYEGDGGLAKNAVVWKPQSIVAGRNGNVYFGDYENSVIRCIAPDGKISTIAGFPQKYSAEDGAVQTTMPPAKGRTADDMDVLYFADQHNNMVHGIAADGSITTLAGTGATGYSGDGGPAVHAQLNKPWGVVTDNNGNVFIADTYNNVVRKMDAAGIISTCAGNGVAGYSGDGGPATAAQLGSPRGIATDRKGNLYITDVDHNVVRIVSAGGIISTIAGNGRRGYSGDKGMATDAQLNWPSGVTVDQAGNVYIADGLNHVVRKVTPLPPPVKKDMPVKDTHIEPVPKAIAVQKAPPVLPEAKKEIPVKDAFTVSADAEKELLTITTDTGAYTSFTITNGAGETLVQQSINGVQTIVDISTLLPARYFINLKKDDKVKTAMFVKDK